MFVERLTVENYRAVRKASVRFDATTVLIGENDSGRTTLLEALAMALGWRASPEGFAVEQGMWPRDGGKNGAPRIVLDLVEPKPGAWDAEGWKPITSWLSKVQPRRVRFEVTLQAPGAGRAAVSWRFLDPVTQQELVDDRALLVWLRGALPVFWMPTGMVLDRSAATASVANSDVLREVEASYNELLEAREGTPTDAQRRLDRGYHAALELTRQLVDESDKGHASHASALEHGSAATKIGLLLLAGGLVRAWTGRPTTLGTPLLLLEAPEAYLHPMTIASVWRVIERLRGQKIIGTHSPVLVGASSMESLRRLVRSDGEVTTFAIEPGSLSPEEQRRYLYHLRSRRSDASFGRVWLLVEGETEFWMLPELARALGYDFSLEGIHCVEFAQAGLSPLLKVAHQLGMGWHVLADGDNAGKHFIQQAQGHLRDAEPRRHLTRLPQRDVETCFWFNGYAELFCRAAGVRGHVPHKAARGVIDHAIRKHSKPGLALMLLDEVNARGPDGVPAPLRHVIEACVQQARRQVEAAPSTRAPAKPRRPRTRRRP